MKTKAQVAAKMQKKKRSDKTQIRVPIKLTRSKRRSPGKAMRKRMYHYKMISLRAIKKLLKISKKLKSKLFFHQVFKINQGGLR
jgi:hypothetical protein